MAKSILRNFRMNFDISEQAPSICIGLAQHAMITGLTAFFSGH
ncbi:hypothetical protein [Prochlorococcus sp. MIT 0601]|nr:hypothetical protein [Prochlorococcus sp. MIT 0601]